MTYNPKTQSTDRKGFEKRLGTPSGYIYSYGIRTDGYFKPFTTQFNLSGVPRYQYPLISSSGLVHGATSTGLNPFGVNTIGEGLIWGTGLPDNLFTATPDPSSVRTYGFKNPLHMVGPGYDIFGYPAPNYDVGWDISGIYNSNATIPSIYFKKEYGSSGIRLNEVPYPFWKAGPLDLRWDHGRGVWTAPNSVYSARVLQSNVTGVINPTVPVFAENIRYDVRINDGLASQLTLTGIMHVGQKPRNNTYKVYPYISGDYCFILHTITNGIPGFGALLYEIPATQSCDATGTSSFALTSDYLYGGSSDGEPWNSSKILTGTGLFAALKNYKIQTQFGGTTKGVYNANSVIIGSGTTIDSKPFINGSGISITIVNTGILIQLSTGVAFVSAGANSNITSLNGLTTPLSVGQGGTGSSTQNFVDLSTSQSISGIKNFTLGIRVPTGIITNPPVNFGDTNFGFSFTSGCLAVATSGRLNTLFAVSGIEIVDHAKIFNATNTSTTSALTIRPGVNQPYSLECLNLIGSGIAGFGISGSIFLGVSGSRINVLPVSTTSGNNTVYLPASGNIPSYNQIPVIYWNRSLSGVQNGSNSGFIMPTAPINSNSVMLFKNGLLQRQGSGYDYTLSGSGIYFNSGNIPAALDNILITYQGIDSTMGAGAFS